MYAAGWESGGGSFANQAGIACEEARSVRCCWIEVLKGNWIELGGVKERIRELVGKLPLDSDERAAVKIGRAHV